MGGCEAAVDGVGPCWFRGSGVTGRVVGWARATGLLLALVSLVGLFAAPALAGTTVGTPGAATPVSGTFSLLGVACSSATSCLAVGYKRRGDANVGVVVSITNGIPGAATPVTGTDVLLGGVACSSATSCVAVGHKGPSDAGVGVVVPVTNGTAGAATTVTGTDFLLGVACSSATSCLAVGVNASTGVGVVVPVTNGIAGTATPVTGTDVLGGVACSSATSCLAVGDAFSDEQVGVVVPVTNGIAGTATTVTGTDFLFGVACSSATSCLAVGQNGVNEPTPRGVVVTITNGTPRATTTAAGTDFLSEVACSSATSCLAVGDKASSEVGVVVPITYALAPGVSGYRLTRNLFVVGGGSPPKAARFNYTLSEAAAVKIVIAQRRAGRRKDKKCVAPTRKLRYARKCTRLTTRGTLTRTSHQGANSVAFTGRIGSTALTPGSYQATLTATDAAQNTSRAQTILFRIVKR